MCHVFNMARGDNRLFQTLACLFKCVVVFYGTLNAFYFF